MGLFSFNKEAGTNLLKNNSQKGETDDTIKIDNLYKALNDLNLDLQNTEIQIEGDKVTISGEALSQSDREKAILAVGNVTGIATVEDNIEVKKLEPEAKFYKVQKGDTLSKIAQTQYGDAMKYPLIFEANKPMLKDPDKIYPGQSLRIPPVQ